MRIVNTIRLIGKGPLAASDEWKSIRDVALAAIKEVDWPDGTNKFTINPVPLQNGVTPIKSRMAKALKNKGWLMNERWPIPDIVAPGRMDGAFKSSQGLVAFEWETGNISSSHRSLNKVCLGLHLGTIVGGILAVSARQLQQYLTDRVGSYEELRAYFPLWQATPCDLGVLEIIVVTYDRVSEQVPLIPKAKTGRGAT